MNRVLREGKENPRAILKGSFFKLSLLKGLFLSYPCNETEASSYRSHCTAGRSY